MRISNAKPYFWGWINKHRGIEKKGSLIKYVKLDFGFFNLPPPLRTWPLPLLSHVKTKWRKAFLVSSPSSLPRALRILWTVPNLAKIMVPLEITGEIEHLHGAWRHISALSFWKNPFWKPKNKIEFIWTQNDAFEQSAQTVHFCVRIVAV